MTREEDKTKRTNKNIFVLSVKLSLWLLLLFFGVLVAWPFFWTVTTGIKLNSMMYVYPPQLIPYPATFDHYLYVFRKAPFALYFCNTGIYAGSRLILNLFLCSLAGYAFARMEFQGKNVLFIFAVATMMIPYQVRYIPLYVIMKRWPLAGGNDILGRGGMGFLDSFPGLILPEMAAGFGIFLMRQFFLTLPRELEDAARIDGCSEFGIYWRIALPLSKAALAVLGLFTFQGAWNDFVWPLIVTNSQKMYILQLGLQRFQDLQYYEWGPVMAATSTAVIPLLLVFLFGQKFFIRGIALGGVKG